MSSLLAEHFRAVKGGGRRFRDRLHDYGISDDAMWRSMIGAAYVRVDDDGTFAPDPDGTPMVILPVCDRYDPPVPLDLVAFTLDADRRSACRTGMAPIVNASAVQDAWWQEFPLLIHATPLDWIKADLAGVVVLDWNPGTVALHLGNARRLISFSPEVVASLTGIFKHDVDPPEIRLAEVRHAA